VAIFKKSREAIRVLLDNGLDIHKNYNDKAVVTMRPIRDQKRQVLKRPAFELGFEVTALRQAMEFKDFDMMRVLIDYGAGSNINKAHHVFLECAFDGLTEGIALLMECVPGIEKVRLSPAVTPLALACQNGHIEVITLLLQAKADINETVNTDTGAGDVTPLRIAFANHQIAVFEYLVQQGADIEPDMVPRLITDFSILDGTSQTARFDKNKQSIMKIVLYKMLEPIVLAYSDASSSDDDFETFNSKYLVQRALLASVMNAPITAAGHTLLILAVIEQDMAKLKLLLTIAGVNPNALLIDNTTALTYAIKNKDVDMMRLLLLHGADPNIVDRKNTNAYVLAQGMDFIEGVALLRDHVVTVTAPPPQRAPAGIWSMLDTLQGRHVAKGPLANETPLNPGDVSRNLPSPGR
jgi:ankyrin repeat protein